MKKQFLIPCIIISVSLLLLSCGQEKGHYSHESMAAADTGYWTATEAKAAKESISSQRPERQFIHTADLKGKVGNVEAATYAIEKLVGTKGGFVVESHLQRDESRKSDTEISPDSILSVTYSTTTNRICLRIPHRAFDSSLYTIAGMFTVLNHRNIRADEVSFQVLRNQLTQKRVQKHEKRLAKSVDARPGKVDEALVGEDALFSLGEKGDEAFVQNLSLGDQVQYSTVTVEIYQEQLTERVTRPNLDNLDAYKPSFYQQAWHSLAFSWEILEEVFLFLLKIWWILGIAWGLVLWNVGRKKRNLLPS